MILRICPYQILKHKQSIHFLKTILSIVNWLISHVKIHVKRKILFNLQCYQCTPCRVGSVGSVSASRTVGREFASRPGHTKDHHKNGTNCLPA